MSKKQISPSHQNRSSAAASSCGRMPRSISWFASALLLTLFHLPHFHSNASKPTSLSEMIDIVRGAVVKVTVILPPGVPDPPNSCFHWSTCVVGTGFFVNDRWDIVTALHVSANTKKLLTDLANNHVPGARAWVEVQFPNVDLQDRSKGRIVMSGNSFSLPFVASAEDEDKIHDLAILSVKPEDIKRVTSRRLINIGKIPDSQFQVHVSSARLDNVRPKDGEDVFACGYPLGAASLVTTSGKIGSAWNSENLLIAHENGTQEVSEVFTLDLDINPGNSGGPVFRNSNQAVVGIVVETKGKLATAIPARYITELLDRRKIPWQSATSKPKK